MHVGLFMIGNNPLSQIDEESIPHAFQNWSFAVFFHLIRLVIKMSIKRWIFSVMQHIINAHKNAYAYSSKLVWQFLWSHSIPQVR